jgi:hypothetical protein
MSEKKMTVVATDVDGLHKELARLKAENKELVGALEPFALMHRDDCDLNEIALTRGHASDMTVLCSRDFEKANEVLAKAEGK